MQTTLITFMPCNPSQETHLYREEGIEFSDIMWTSNHQLLDLLAGKKSSIMALLEDQCLVASGTDEGFVGSMNTVFKNHRSLVKSKMMIGANFCINHSIGQINYCATGFLFKNKDVLRAELVEIIQHSKNAVAAGMFAGVSMEKGKLAKGQLIGSQFMNQLTELMGIIQVGVVLMSSCTWTT